MRIFGFDLRTLVSNSTANIHEDRSFRVPSLHFLFYRVDSEPVRHAHSTRCHVLIEVIELFGKLGEELEDDFICFVRILEYSVGVIGDILETGLSQECRKLLVDRANEIEAVFEKVAVSLPCSPQGS